jgi:TPR repeat protein
MKFLFSSLILSIYLLIPAQANANFDDGLVAADKGDFATALKEWKPLAEQGYANAQFNLGLMYQKGDGVLKDYKQAVAWFRKVRKVKGTLPF